MACTETWTHTHARTRTHTHTHTHTHTCACVCRDTQTHAVCRCFETRWGTSRFPPEVQKLPMPIHPTPHPPIYMPITKTVNKSVKLKNGWDPFSGACFELCHYFKNWLF